MKNFIQDYFYYTRIERNGSIALLLLSFCCLIFVEFSALFFPKYTCDFSAFQSEIQAFELLFAEDSPSSNTIKPIITSSFDAPPTSSLFSFNPNTATASELSRLGLSPKVVSNLLAYRSKGGIFFQAKDIKKIYGLTNSDYKRLAAYINLPNNKLGKKTDNQQKNEIINQTQSKISSQQLFTFNPNTASIEDLQNLGLSAKVANTIINFRKKGGTFRRPKDLSRIYGLSKSDFKLLKPYIQLDIPQQKQPAENQAIASTQLPKVTPTSYDKGRLSIDINLSNATEWKQLPGIGHVFSKRIVNFREKLGGFASIEQIGETYGLPDSTFQNLKPFLRASPVYRKISINTANTDDLSTHPYLKSQQAKILIAYREQHGAFKSIDDIKKVRAFNQQLLDKLTPYLNFE